MWRYLENSSKNLAVNCELDGSGEAFERYFMARKVLTVVISVKITVSGGLNGYLRRSEAIYILFALMNTALILGDQVQSPGKADIVDSAHV